MSPETCSRFAERSRRCHHRALASKQKTAAEGWCSPRRRDVSISPGRLFGSVSVGMAVRVSRCSARAQLFANDVHIPRRFNPQPHRIRPDPHNGNRDVFPHENLLARLSRQHQHLTRPFLSRSFPVFAKASPPQRSPAFDASLTTTGMVAEQPAIRSPPCHQFDSVLTKITELRAENPAKNDVSSKSRQNIPPEQHAHADLPACHFLYTTAVCTHACFLSTRFCLKFGRRLSAGGLACKSGWRTQS